jgi:hypothetical protein
MPEARLQLIAEDESIPLGALPKAMISSLIEAAQQSTSETRNRLLRRFDRRQTGPWKVLRNRLAEDHQGHFALQNVRGDYRARRPPDSFKKVLHVFVHCNFVEGIPIQGVALSRRNKHMR